MHSALRYLGYESSLYNSQCIRIGYGTHLAIRGFSDDVIKAKGRENQIHLNVIFVFSKHTFTLNMA